MEIPEGWTDDMSVRMNPDGSVEDLVRSVMAALLSGEPAETICARIAADFGVHEEDLALVLDRVQGGIVRALTANTENAPSPVKDPVAWASFQAAWATLPRKHWWSRLRKPGGPWDEWFEANQRTSA